MPAHFHLQPVPPFRLDLTVWTLRRRATNRVDRWDGETYRRVLPLEGGAVEIAVRQLRSGRSPRLEAAVCGGRLGARRKAEITNALERLLGLRTVLADFYRLADAEPKLGELVHRFRGMKPPRFPSAFEALANAIACQQISLEAGMQLLNRLAASYGVAAANGDCVEHAFPRPQDLAKESPGALRRLGFTQQKSRALIELSQSVAGGRLDLGSLEDCDNLAAMDALLALHGIGRWSAEYALLRGFGRLDVIPGDDVGAQKRLRERLGLRRKLDHAAVTRVLKPWRPYAGLIYFHLLLDGLSQAGHI